MKPLRSGPPLVPALTHGLVNGSELLDQSGNDCASVQPGGMTLANASSVGSVVLVGS